MATSRTALQTPRTARAAALATTPGLTAGSVTASESAAALTVVTTRLPSRAITHPAVGSAATAPTAMASRRKPRLPSLRASRDLSSGMWGSQLARTSPLRRKQTDTARRAVAEAPLLARLPLTAMVPDSVAVLDAKRAVERDGAGPSGEEEDQDGAPYEMLRPCLRIYEELNGHDHAEQRQRREPAGQSQDEQGRAPELEAGRHSGGRLGRDSGQLVLVGEERRRRVPDPRLLEAGAEEDNPRWRVGTGAGAGRRGSARGTSGSPPTGHGGRRRQAWVPRSTLPARSCLCSFSGLNGEAAENIVLEHRSDLGLHVDSGMGLEDDFDRLAEVHPTSEGIQQRVRPRLDRAHDHPFAGRADFQPHAAPAYIHAQVLTLRLMRPPDPLHRPRRCEMGERGVEGEGDVRHPRGIDGAQALAVERGDRQSRGGSVHRPFEPRDVGQVRKMRAGRKLGEELREVRAVLAEARARRWVPADEGVGGVAEEAPIDEGAHHGIHGLEDGRQRSEHVMAIDAEASASIEPVALDEIEEDGVLAAEQAGREALLELRQREHGHPFARPRRGASLPSAPRPAARRAREYPCP